MLKIIQTWVQRYFSNEEAVVLLFLLIASFVVVITMGKMLAPVIASVILAYLMQGLVSKLEQVNIPHLLAVTLVFTFFVSLFLMLLLFVVPSVWNQSIKLLTEMPQKIDQLQTLMLLLPERYPDLISPERLQEWINLASQELAKLGQWAVSFSLSSIPNLVALLVYFVLVPMLVFFFLKDRKIIGQRLAALLPAENKLMLRIGQEMNVQIANYIRGKVLEIFIVGGTTFVVFTILGLNYAALLALIVGFSVLVPYIGATMATVPVAIIAYLQWGFGSEFFYVIIAYAIIQALDGNLLVPILFSEAVNLHPVAIIVAVLVFGGLWGFWGVFFAIPLATLLKAVFNAWPRKRPVELHGHDAV